ncbi:MAG: hypothetical protein WCK73_10900 [Deltaproteobacteria bacterium]
MSKKVKVAADMKKTFEQLAEGRDLLTAAARTRNALKKTFGQVTTERERVAGVEKKKSEMRKSVEQVKQGKALLARPTRAPRPQPVKPKPVRSKKSR